MLLKVQTFRSYKNISLLCNLRSRFGLGLLSTMESISKEKKILNLNNINQNIQNVQYAVRGPILIKTFEIEEELQNGVQKPFSRILRTNIGDAQALGQKSITWVRQVLTACLYPEICTANIFPSDVVARSQQLLKTFKGNLGTYSESNGSAWIRQNVAKFISRRDGCLCSPDNIFLTNGASSAIRTILFTLISLNNNLNTGILTPIPQYPLYSATISEFGGTLISYYLDESRNWSLNISECQQILDQSKLTCIPKAMVVINPGNPTGQVLNYENMRNVVHFCIKNRLLLLADEVYQENVYDLDSRFYSFRKVIADMGISGDEIELISFHSVSKGFFGECGLRGGYMEFFGIGDEVKKQIYKLLTVQLCPNSSGQVAVDAMVNPPTCVDPSYHKYINEKTGILTALREKSIILSTELNSIDEISCNPIQGAMYAFPSLQLPSKFVQEAQVYNRQPDEHYCFKVLEETGIVLVPGSGFKQRPGTFHFRMTILPRVDDIIHAVNQLKSFHLTTLKQYY